MKIDGSKLFVQISPAMEAFVKNLDFFGQSINNWIETHKTDIERFALGSAAFAAEIGQLAKSAQDSFDARMKVYPALEKEILPLAKRGWFVSNFFGLSELDLLAQEAGTVSADELDLLVARLYREDIADHVDSILSHYPERTFLLRPAVEAHLRGEYGISIPMFFILTDGICFERAPKKYLFQGSGDKHISSRAKSELTALQDTSDENSIMGFFALVSGIMWASISEKLPIAYNEGARDQFQYDGLNRHTILHGIADQSYATEENSLKAFSLLSCIAGLLATPE